MVDTILYALLSNAILATLLAVAAVLVTRVARNPALGHALWVLVLLKLVTPPLVPLPILWPAPVDSSADHSALFVLVESPELHPLVDDVPTGPEQLVASPETSDAAIAWQPFVIGVWVTGSLCWWALAAFRVIRFRRLLRLAVPADISVQNRASQLAARLELRRCPQVWFVAAPLSPLLWALFGRPRLLLPAALWGRLSETQREALLVHELAHLCRGDHWVRRLELIALGLFWWHPVAWWCRHALVELEERCCDAWVVWALPTETEAYASALVETVAFVSASRSALPLAASGMGYIRSLKRRLHMISHGPQPRCLSRLGLLAVCAVGALLLPLLPTRAVPPQSESADDDLLVTPASGAQELSSILVGIGDETPVEALVEEMKRLRLRQLAGRVDMAAAYNRWKAANALYQGRESSENALEMLMKARADYELARTQVLRAEAALKAAEGQVQQAARHLEVLTKRDKPGTTGEAAALFPVRRHDFGAISTDGKLAWSAQMVNPTRQTFRLSGVRVTDPAVSASPRSVELKPNDQGTIAVWIDPSRFRGTKTFQVWVHFSEPREEQVLLELKAAHDPANKAAPPITAQDRLRDLDKRLERLLKELDELRRDIRSGGKSAGLTDKELQSLAYYLGILGARGR